MKPTRAQYFFAEGWPIRIFFIPWLAVPILFTYVTARTLAPIFSPLLHWWNLLRYTALILSALLLGALIALVLSSVLGWIVLLPIHYLRGRMNGGPFVEGDTVRVIAGPSSRAHRPSVRTCPERRYPRQDGKLR
jgi:hypothetical protein